MENIVIPAQKRELGKSKNATQVRRDGMIPAIIYGDKDPVPVSISLHDVRHAIYTPNFHIVQVDVDGSSVRCIVKDVQFHPVTDDVMHVDFLRLVEGRKIKVEVPLKFTGSSAGTKAGGKLQQKVRKVKIKAAPENLVNELVMDVSDLKLGQSLRIRDINAGDGIEVLNSPGIPVASIEIPRALKSAEAEAAKPAAGAEAKPAEGKAEAGKEAPKKEEGKAKE